MVDETIVDETTTSETIKYSKNGTTDVFENFEPWRYGEPAIPTGLYFLGTDEKANGYQQYFDTNGYGVEEVNATDSNSNQLFKINDRPIRGCVKGTVVTAHKLAGWQYNTEIWASNGKIYYKHIKGSAVELTTADGTVPKRLGIALIGGGGACGGTKSVHWKNDCCEFDTEMPGGGGGGGGVVWGIINLEALKENWKYKITVGAGGYSPGASGKDTILSLSGPFTNNVITESVLASAGGGGGGSTGKKSGAVGGAGGTCTFVNKSDNFIYCGQQPGKSGGSYSEINEGNEAQDINSSVEANEFSIAFIPEGSKEAAGDTSHNGMGTTVKEIAEKKGNVYLAVPGGNSYGNGGYQQIDGALVVPTLGGGGMCWTFNDSNPENIWADNANSFKPSSTTARCGARGGWVLFY